MKQHEKAKLHKGQVKVRDGKFSNSYAPETLRMASIGGQIAGDMEGSVKGGRIVPMHAAEMPTATGLKKAKPERLTTIR